MSDSFKVLFVCTANMCRSPMADGILNAKVRTLDLSIEVKSAGIIARQGGFPASSAVEISRQRGVDISNHLSTPVTRGLLADTDLILVMAKEHHSFIRNYFKEAKEKTHYLKQFDREEPVDYTDVDDPIGLSMEAYQRCYSELETEILRILPTIEDMAHQKTGG